MQPFLATPIAIALPIIASLLDNSREPIDTANIRSPYAEVADAALTNPEKEHTAIVNKVQQTTGWNWFV